MLQRMRDNFTTQSELQEAFSVNAIVFFAIFAMINGLTDDEFRERHENLIVIFAVLRILIGFGVILPDKTTRIFRKARSGNTKYAIGH